MTKNLDAAVKPFPVLQIINLVMGIVMVAWEWPLGFLAGTAMHRSIEARLVILPLTSLAAVLLYQGTNAALYYAIGLMVYFWAYSEGEVCVAVPRSVKSRKLTAEIDRRSQTLVTPSAHPPRQSLIYRRLHHTI